MEYLFKIYIFITSLWSTTQQAMLLELGGKWGTECLDARFPLPTLLCAGIQREADLIDNNLFLGQQISNLYST